MMLHASMFRLGIGGAAPYTGAFRFDALAKLPLSFLLTLLTLLFLGCEPGAEGPVVRRIEIGEYGIYTEDVVGRINHRGAMKRRADEEPSPIGWERETVRGDGLLAASLPSPLSMRCNAMERGSERRGKRRDSECQSVALIRE